MYSVSGSSSSMMDALRRFMASALRAVVGVALVCIAVHVQAQTSWQTNTRSVAGPTAQVALPPSGGKQRAAFIAFEFARNCDPIFSFVEVVGSRFGEPIEQLVLRNSSIGIVLNGTFHTWHAAMTRYRNGYEAGFGITNELLFQLLINLDTLAYVTPAGETVPLPTSGFKQSVQSAIDACRMRAK